LQGATQGDGKGEKNQVGGEKGLGKSAKGVAEFKLGGENAPWQSYFFFTSHTSKKQRKGAAPRGGGAGKKTNERKRGAE